MHKIILVLSSLMLLSCSSGSTKNWDTVIFESLQKLEADKVMVDIEIEGKKFYAKDISFDGRATINKLSCLLDFKTPFGGDIGVRLEGIGWSQLKGIVFQNGLSVSDSISGVLLIGRKLEGKNEGYIMKEGHFKIRQLNQEACIIVIHGMLENPLNKSIAKPINGLIVWKKPKGLLMHSPQKDFYF
jgi:hypothetical protein